MPHLNQKDNYNNLQLLIASIAAFIIDRQRTHTNSNSTITQDKFLGPETATSLRDVYSRIEAEKNVLNNLDSF